MRKTYAGHGARRLTTLFLSASTCTALVVVVGPPGTAIACEGTANPALTSRLSVRNVGAVDGWNAEQVSNAVAIITEGRSRRVAPRGWVIALATAMQESSLRNYANTGVAASLAEPYEALGHDHDSVGLFQQRPSPPDGAGSWGSAKELMRPSVAAGKFYAALTRIPGWHTLPLAVAAQRVQVSAFPDAYAKWEPEANILLTAITGISVAELPGANLIIPCAPAAVVSSVGWTRPAPGPVTSVFGPRGASFHRGVDFGSARHAAVRSAASGRVVYAGCDPATVNCDVNGGLSVPGCGYFVEVLHDGGTATRYCHLIRRPDVRFGQQVTAGQVLGLVGMSGNSTGPHLHFEVHVNVPCDAHGCRLDPVNAVDPITFLAAKGVSLG